MEIYVIWYTIVLCLSPAPKKEAKEYLPKHLKAFSSILRPPETKNSAGKSSESAETAKKRGAKADMWTHSIVFNNP